MARIFLSRKIPEAGMKRLGEFTGDFLVFPHDRPITENELIENIDDVEGLLCLLTDPVTRRVIEAGKRLKIIANYAVGYENIDVKSANERGILVTNTPGVLTDATAELAWALLFACARRIVEADRFTREKRFNGWSPTLLLGTELKDKILGLIGAGRIGTAFALKGRGFGMRVLYCDNHENEVLQKAIGAEMVKMEELLKRADFISSHVPLTEKTYHLMGKRELALLKPSAYLINTSRGAVIDEKALIRALKEGRIRGAGLDVYENEPKISHELLGLSNVVLLPHIGSATHVARDKMAETAVENLIAGLNGKTPPNLVTIPKTL
ncbi:D-glycerate dehydrogenase [candidate division WOR-3 bacterium JGI_Cruoil_03_44_89]|uniref:D-glycerate dehydrogenase n=1 Tax=candidate division WOR-3 bacterium JGI_Cruoil_03_44_89 TaxID=1973748 RepID=A0A235BXU7_UNCW3|nr:MAG: D-glycerate dehydrogenase [candidate division WOR-3 bacterium JGI_Cruoil_03_44_89]